MYATRPNRVLQIGTRFTLPFPNLVSKIIEIVTRLANPISYKRSFRNKIVARMATLSNSTV